MNGGKSRARKRRKAGGEEAERVASGSKGLLSDDLKFIFMWQVNGQLEKQEDEIVRF